MILCSIVIPTYNAGKSICETLDSIELDKKWSNSIEVLVVDDGSIDNTAFLVSEYVDKYSNILYIKKENGGVSSARNYGIREASGKYITFVDADDKLNRKVLEQMISVAEQNNVELVITDYICKQIESGQIFEMRTSIPYETILYEDYIHNEIFKRYFTDNNTGISNVWGKLFSLQTIKNKNIRFNEKMSHGEDWDFCIQYFKSIYSLYSIKSFSYEYKLDGTQSYSKHKKNLAYCLISGHKTLLGLNEKFLHYKMDSFEYVNFMRVFYFQIISYLMLDIKKEKKDEFLKDKSVQNCFAFLGALNTEQLIKADFSRKDKIAFFLLSKGIYRLVIGKIY